MAADESHEDLWRQSTSLISGTSSFQQPVDKELSFNESDPKCEQRVRAALQAYSQFKSGHHKPVKQASLLDQVLVRYGRYIYRNDSNLDSYRKADQYVVLRLIKCLKQDDKKINKDHIQKRIMAVIYRISPYVAHLSPSARKQYVTDVVERVWKSPEMGKMRLQTEESFSQPKAISGQPTAPPLDDPERVYHYMNARAKYTLQEQNQPFNQQKADEQIVRQLWAKGYSKEHIRAVLQYSPEIKFSLPKNREEYIEQAIYRFEQKEKELRRVEEENSHFQEFISRGIASFDLDL